MLAAGLPLLRVTLHCGTLHPQFLGATYTWWRISGRTRAVMIAHEVADLIPYGDSPVRRVTEGGEVLRRRLEGTGAVLDFSVLHDLKARGATDYYALPVTSALGSRRYMATYVTDRPGGFTAPEVEELTGISTPGNTGGHVRPARDRRECSEGLYRPGDGTAGPRRPNPPRRR